VQCDDGAASARILVVGQFEFQPLVSRIMKFKLTHYRILRPLETEKFTKNTKTEQGRASVVSQFEFRPLVSRIMKFKLTHYARPAS